MEQTGILQSLNLFCEKLGSRTFLGSYKDTQRSSLLNEGLSTRANALWKMAEYIVAFIGKQDNDGSEKLQDYIKGWKTLASNFSNQYLLLEIDKNVWRMYDSQGNELGNEDYILAHLKAKTNTTKEYKQVIYFGAPGTGKSHKVNQDSSVFASDNIERVTFYPTYTYQQFVGAYKPSVKEDSEGKEYITYTYVPGPFIRLLTQAYQNSGENYLLIIEELNRANAAGVFGDLFQLLDRCSDGKSEYPVAISEDLKAYLEKTEKEASEENKLIKIATCGYTRLSLPSNLYIWATMNSADQGVFPIDTAFKRRWDFEYLGIDTNEDKIKNYCFQFKDGKYYWNTIRKTINEKLLAAKINEDKLLGPFFIKLDIIESGNDALFLETFKSKVLMYLFEDAIRHNPAALFKGKDGLFSYSIICKQLDEGGLKSVFNFDIEPAKDLTDSSDNEEQTNA